MNIYYFNITVLRNRNVFGEVVKTLDDYKTGFPDIDYCGHLLR